MAFLKHILFTAFTLAQIFYNLAFYYILVYCLWEIIGKIIGSIALAVIDFKGKERNSYWFPMLHCDFFHYSEFIQE